MSARGNNRRGTGRDQNRPARANIFIEDRRNIVPAVFGPPLTGNSSSDESDLYDSDDGTLSISDEEQNWEQDWDSDSQEPRRPEFSSSSDSSSEDSDNSIEVLLNNQPVQIALSPSRNMPAENNREGGSGSENDEPRMPKRRRLAGDLNDSQLDENTASTSTTPAPEEDDNIDDGCTICYEVGFSCFQNMSQDYTSNGEHRLVSLKCGHFFGKSCIERWVRSEGRAAACPNCKQKAQIKDVRIHFSKAVQMTDNSELEDLKRTNTDLQNKNTCLEMELAMTKREVADLQSKFEESAGKLKVVQLPTVIRAGRMVLKQWLKLSLCPIPNHSSLSRAFDYNGGSFAVGVKLASTGPFGQFGIKPAVICWKEGNETFVAKTPVMCHTNKCKVVVFSPHINNLVLSAGEDKKAVVQKLGNSSIRPQTWNLDSQVWSGCWLTKNTFALGLGNGYIYEYDTESVDNEPKKNLNQRLDLANLPIVFLAYDPDTTVLLASSLIKMSSDDFMKIRSIAWDARTLSFAATVVTKDNTIAHKLYKLDIEERMVLCIHISTWQTPCKKSTTMWDNCLFSIRDRGTFSLIFDEDNRRLEAHDWSETRPNVCLPFPAKENVCSMRAFTDPKGEQVVALLTEQTIYMIKFGLTE